MRYKIIKGNSRNLLKFEEEMKYYLDSGWICQGGVNKFNDHHADIIYCQALIRYDSLLERIQRFTGAII